MEWNGVSQAASFQFGPWSKWVRNGTLRAVSATRRRQNEHCRALHLKGVEDFREVLVSYVLSPDTTPLDAIIMSIDMEGLSSLHHPIPGPSSIGVATLDTRALFNLSIPPSKKIHTKLFHRGALKYFWQKRRENGKYLFSDREPYTKETAEDALEKIFAHCDGRNVILLGHETRHELDMMARMKFKPEEHASIIHILDTGLIANLFDTEFVPVEHGTPRGRHSLRHILEEFGIG